LPDTPRRAASELPIQLALGFAHQAVSGHVASAVEQAFVRAHALCQEVDDPPQYLTVLRGLTQLYFSQGKVDQAQALTEQYLSLAQRLQDPEHVQKAHTRLGWILLRRAELAAAQTHLEQSLALYDPQQFQAGVAWGVEPGVDALSCLTLVLLCRGYPDQAMERSRQSLALAREQAHPWSLASALDSAARLYMYRDWQALQEAAEAMQALMAEHKLAHYWASGAMFYKGYALVMQGQIAEGLNCMRQGGAARLDLQRYFIESCWRCEQIEEGLALVEECLADASLVWQKTNQMMIYWLKGELLLAQTEAQQAEAERCWHYVLDLACQQQYKWMELKVSTSLSRLWQRQGKRDAAFELLTEVYGWFTEGFEFPPLQEAKALIETLKRP
jgi:adenylate cyclase